MSGFTPTVFSSWKLAAGRVPCYFILCLLLLEVTPQTRKVAMGYLLNSPPTAQEHDHHQTRKLGGLVPSATLAAGIFSWATIPPTQGAVVNLQASREPRGIATNDDIHVCKWKAGNLLPEFVGYTVTGGKFDQSDTFAVVMESEKVARDRDLSLVLFRSVEDAEVHMTALESFTDFVEDAEGTTTAFVCSSKGSRPFLTEEDVASLKAALSFSGTLTMTVYTLLAVFLCSFGFGFLVGLAIMIYRKQAQDKKSN
eukprot:GHVS01051802.1.p1 GENE.GHVS01051802.1~~GHVS01051802.1.p1  ORF type:complete len:254 (+),score=20.53 GHVS01051802.1:214-975(+)